MAFATVAWQKVPTLAKAGTKIDIRIQSTILAQNHFVLYVGDVFSLGNKKDEIMLKISLFTFGRNLQFFNCHDFVRFSDRHHLTKSSFQRFDCS